MVLQLFNFVILYTVGLLGQGISRYLHTGWHKHRTNVHTDIHALSGIRTHDPSFRAGEDCSCFRPLVHWDRRRMELQHDYFLTIKWRRKPSRLFVRFHQHFSSFDLKSKATEFAKRCLKAFSCSLFTSHEQYRGCTRHAYDFLTSYTQSLSDPLAVRSVATLLHCLMDDCNLQVS
jgi:hypothetical protein